MTPERFTIAGAELPDHVSEIVNVTIPDATGWSETGEAEPGHFMSRSSRRPPPPAGPRASPAR